MSDKGKTERCFTSTAAISVDAVVKKVIWAEGGYTKTFSQPGWHNVKK